MYRVGYILILLLLYSCNQVRKYSNVSPTYFYVGSNKIENYLAILKQTEKVDEYVIIYSKRRKSESSRLFKNIAAQSYKIKRYSINNISYFNSTRSLMVILLLDANIEDFNTIHDFIQKNSKIVSVAVTDSMASTLLFRKIAYPLRANDSMVSRVGVKEIKISNGMNLIDQPIVLVNSGKLTRFSEMLSASLQNPTDYVISVDDSTSFSIFKNVIKVYGKGQMFMVKHPDASTKVENGLFGGENLQISVFLPGDSVIIK